jgi:hypothetical protein
MIAGRQFWPSRAVDDEGCRLSTVEIEWRAIALAPTPPNCLPNPASVAVEMHGKHQNRRPERRISIA